MKWIVIANRSGADVYDFTADHTIKLIHHISNPLGRMRNRLMQYDKAGQSRAKLKGSAPHLLTREKDPHEDAADQFARALSKFFKGELVKRKSLTLNIVAEAKMLGKIKAQFDNIRISERIEWTTKDLEKVPKSKWPKILNLEPALIYPKRIPLNGSPLARNTGARS
ncbi:MAG: hypothetical protein BroJett040_14560 [Oligoflexia bacterium]|nr:MAG: hypothetical protein BroJett040_14560 [Oligoflexia bacterium]